MGGSDLQMVPESGNFVEIRTLLIRGINSAKRQSQNAPNNILDMWTYVSYKEEWYQNYD